MLAIVVRNNGNNLYPYLEDVEIPKCGDNEVIIEVYKTGICGSDFHLFSENTFSGVKSFPQIIGHEFSGKIVYKGKYVTDFNINDFVACESVISCGKCSDCKLIEELNCQNAELLGFTKPGAYAQYVCIDYRYVHNINSLVCKFGLEKGCILGALLEPLGCAYKSIFLINKNQNFDKKVFVILGAGPIGLGAAWLLSSLTKAFIFIVDEVESRLNCARYMGCKTIKRHISENFFLEDLPKVDFLFETSGVQMNLDRIIPTFFNSGSTMIYIARNSIRFNYSMDTFVSNDFTLVASRGHRGSFKSLIEIMLNKNVETLLEIVEKKQIKLKDLSDVLVDKDNLLKGKIIVDVKNSCRN